MTAFERFNKFLVLLQARQPKLNIKYKDESKFMKFLGKLLFFNPKFMTNYITTIGNTSYFPNRQEVESAKDLNYLDVLAHEFVHVQDYNRHKFLFIFLYLLPLTLAPLMLLFIILKWWVGLLLFLVCLCPLPAYGRKKYEFRGYTMTMLISDEANKEINMSLEARKTDLESWVDIINSYFTTGAYYFMWPFGVKKELEKTIDKILNNKLDDEVFSQIIEDFRASKNV